MPVVRLLTGTLVALLAATTAAQAATHYVNNLHSSCSDSGPGTSTSAPWCSFTPVNNHGPYSPGDQILLARGATWTEQMNVTGSGTSTSWITLGAYGTGNRPIIRRSSPTGQNSHDERGIKLTNPDFWRIQDLEVSNAAAGIMVFFNTTGHEGLLFENIFVHDNTGIRQGKKRDGGFNQLSKDEHLWESAGIVITGATPPNYGSSSPPLIKNIRMNNIEGTRNLDSISFDFMGHSQWSNDSDGGDFSNVAQDIVLNHLFLHDDDNNNAGIGTNKGCDEGMRLTSLRHAVVMNSILTNEGSCASDSGTTAVFLGRLKDVSFVNSIIRGVNAPPLPSGVDTQDQAAFDYEYYLENVRVRNMLMTDTYGAGVSFLQLQGSPELPRANDSLTNVEATGNLLLNNQQGAFRIFKDEMGGSTSGVLRDNLIDAPFFYFNDKGNFDAWSKINNIPISDAYHSADQFSDTQGHGDWTYEVWNGSSYQNMQAFDASTGTWRINSSTNVPQIRQFVMHPGNTSQWAARGWTAPQAGTVSIRGLILKAEVGGDGVIARITKNGTAIWADHPVASHDQFVGVEQVLDGVTVAADDVIRFEVHPNVNDLFDTVSWVPMIAYTTKGEVDQSNSTAAFTDYHDIRGPYRRLQTFVASSSSLPQIDVWSARHGNAAALNLQIFSVDANNNPVGGALSTLTVTPTRMNKFGWLTLRPLLSGLTVGARFGFALSSPATADAVLANAYGFGYNDSNVFPSGVERFSGNGGASWSTETNRSLKFVLYKNAAAVVADQNNSAGTFTNYNDIRNVYRRMQTFTATSAKLPKVDIWAYKAGAPLGDLVISIHAVDASNNPAAALFTTVLPPSAVSATPGWLTVYTNLTGLTSGGKFAVMLSSPATADSGLTNAYGFGYNDGNLYPTGVERISGNGGASWSTESNRSLKFITYK